MKRILIILFALVLILLAMTFLFNRGNDKEVVLNLIFLDKTIKLNELAQFGAQEISTAGGDRYTGYSLQEMMIKLNEKPEDYTSIIFSSSDGSSLAVDISELLDLYLINFSRDGEQYLRLIIPSDNFSQRWLKYISIIEFKNDQTD